jgi:hypothetical protein
LDCEGKEVVAGVKDIKFCCCWLGWSKQREEAYREMTPVGLCRRERWWQGSGTQNSAVVGSAVLNREKKHIP